MSFRRHVCNYEDVDLKAEAGEWVARDAADMAESGYELVSFSVCQHMSGDGAPLPGASVWAIYKKAVTPCSSTSRNAGGVADASRLPARLVLRRWVKRKAKL